ncbi:hypothetical protein ACLMJK_002746 [Lecanora helva]
MSERPALKLKLSAPQIPKQESQESPPLTTPSLKLKFGKKTTSKSPAPPTPPAPQAPSEAASLAVKLLSKPKPARKPKPTPKKRALEEDVELPSSDGEGASASGPVSAPQPKKIKFTTKPQPKKVFINASNVKGKKPVRPLGVGYDSEASDREDDPAITESFILRMEPGPDCDYLRAAVAAGNFGKKSEGGADVRMKFLRADGRRAVIVIRGTHYAAILVDLPCIVEAMKSWFPKTGWMKSSDICQMLMVLGPIKNEEDALTYPLPLDRKGEFDEKTWQWAHGLTPPMQWVRKRRFRKRISVRTVMEVEAEVERLLQRDDECEGEATFEIIDRGGGDSEAGSQDISDDDEDAEGDIDYQDQQPETPLETIEGEEDEEAENARMAEMFERQMMANEENDPDSSQPVTSTGPSFESATGPESASTPPSVAGTPSAAVTPVGAAVDTSSAAEDDESDEDDEEEEADEDQMERQQEMQKLKEEVEDLEAAIKGEQAKLAGMPNALLKQRIADKIRGLQGDLELKVKAMGGGED